VDQKLDQFYELITFRPSSDELLVEMCLMCHVTGVVKVGL